MNNFNNPFHNSGKAPDQKSSIIESLHVYALEEGNLHEKDISGEAELSSKIETALEKYDFSSIHVSMMDDIKPVRKMVMTNENHPRIGFFMARELQRHRELVPNHYKLFQESHFTDDAYKKQESLKNRVLELSDTILIGEEEVHVRLNTKQDKIIIGSGKRKIDTSFEQEILIHNTVENTGVESSSYESSCEVFDMCVYEEKLKHTDMAITILPSSFEEQQKRVQMLFAIQGTIPRVINVFTTEKSDELEIYAWQKEDIGLIETIIEEVFSSRES